MKKLEDIPKKNIFEVPDGYFDKLPLEIQNRTSSSSPRFSWNLAVGFKFAIPVVILMVIGIVWFSQTTPVNVENELSKISDEELVAYLSDSDLSTEELTEAVTFSKEDINDLEVKVYGAFENTEESVEEIANELNIEL